MTEEVTFDHSDELVFHPSNYCCLFPARCLDENHLRNLLGHIPIVHS